VVPNHSQLVVNGKIRDVGVNGVDAHYAEVRNLVIVHGRKFDDSDMTLREHVALLTGKLAIRVFGIGTGTAGRLMASPVQP